MADEVVEQTLAQFREVNLYKIPPRSGASGHRSGSWQVADKVFTGRLRVVSTNDDCEIRVIDPQRHGLRKTPPPLAPPSFKCMRHGA